MLILSASFFAQTKNDLNFINQTITEYIIKSDKESEELSKEITPESEVICKYSENVKKRKIYKYDLDSDMDMDYLVLFSLETGGGFNCFGEGYYMVGILKGDDLNKTNVIDLHSVGKNGMRVKSVQSDNGKYIFTIEDISRFEKTDYAYVINYDKLSNSLIKSEKEQSKKKQPDYEAPKMKNIGDAITVGYFTYKVNNITYRESIGAPYFRKTADGIYLVVDLTITNNDRETRTLDNSMFSLYDNYGYEYECSDDVLVAMTSENKELIFIKKFPPRIPKNSQVVFEVPNSKALYKLKISGGFWTNKYDYILLTN